MSLVDSIIARMQEWKGCKEGSSTHAHIIALYNLGKDEGEYTMTLSDPWCAACIGAAAFACGAAGIIPISASCDRMINQFKAVGRFFERGTYVPKKGDLIFYDWDENSSADHVGLITNVEGTTVYTIEGNRANTVCECVIPVYGTDIKGFGVPNYDGEAVYPVELSPSVHKYTSYFSQLNLADQFKVRNMPMLQDGSDDVYVTLLQFALVTRTGKAIAIDGQFGPETRGVLLEWQSDHNLEVDGICGPETWASLLIA